MPGNNEFHARLNSFTAGSQRVVWCYDADNDGCRDEWVKSSISINWIS
ncbi:MAG: hypothetical protein M3R01_05085 [Actinomycetota bacterium]|nr:hypothetical protein [Acidimicrobiia bacterium]MDQ3146293.1 hypothetical protein [Actinomycetota bacterium]